MVFSDCSAMICPENALLLELLVNFRLAQIWVDFFFRVCCQYLVVFGMHFPITFV